MLERLRSFTRQEWQVLLATWLGTIFDGMDASIFVLALYPTLSELLNTSSHAQVGMVASYILAAFMVGWAVGAAFFGALADRIGRVNTMALTILLYAICTGLCATSHNCWELGIYRFFVGCGIGGEISVGAVFLAETWKGRPRYWATGMLCTAFGIGYLITALLNYGLGAHGWRALYFVGMLPAFLTIYIRLKLQESTHFTLAIERRERRRSRGARRLAFLQMFNKSNRSKTACVLTLAVSAIIGYWAVLSWIPAWVNQLTGHNATMERSTVAVVFNIGAIVGALVLGVFFDKLGHKKAFFLSFTGALISCLCLFLTVHTWGPELLSWVFVVGIFSEAPFVPLFIYVPELFNADIRGTAFGISIQAGRLLAAMAAIMAGQLIALFGGSYAMAGSCIALMYLAGMGASLVLPKTTGEVLPIPDFDRARRKVPGAVFADEQMATR